MAVASVVDALREVVLLFLLFVSPLLGCRRLLMKLSFDGVGSVSNEELIGCLLYCCIGETPQSIHCHTTAKESSIPMQQRRVRQVRVFTIVDDWLDAAGRGEPFEALF